MKKYYPSWYKRYPSCKKDKSYLTDYAQFRWRAGKGKMISDPDGYQKKNAVLSDQERKVVSYHEIGHALVAALQTHSAPVQKITIIPRTSGALG